MSNSNYRVASWSDIRERILKRIGENQGRLASCNDEDVRPVLLRIAHDDEQRLISAEQWIQYHQQA